MIWTDLEIRAGFSKGKGSGVSGDIWRRNTECVDGDIALADFETEPCRQWCHLTYSTPRWSQLNDLTRHSNTGTSQTQTFHGINEDSGKGA